MDKFSKEIFGDARPYEPEINHLQRSIKFTKEEEEAREARIAQLIEDPGNEVPNLKSKIDTYLKIGSKLSKIRDIHGDRNRTA